MKGLVNYREAHLDDPAWWRRLRILISGLSRENDRAVYQARLDMQLALVANGRLTDESWEDSQEAAGRLRDDIISTYRPWEGRSFRDRQKKDFKDWRQRYIDAFGVDPNDPEFKEWEANAIAAMQEVSVEVETDDQRVSRLLQEREVEKAKRKADDARRP